MIDKRDQTHQHSKIARHVFALIMELGIHAEIMQMLLNRFGKATA